MKTEGTYPAVVRGVSEQIPQDRRPGQHWAQDNMISDPVKGLARRHGSLNLDELVVGNYTVPQWASWVVDTGRHKVAPFYVEGKEYDFIYRSTARASGAGDALAFLCFNKENNIYLPVTLGTGTLMANLLSGGVSAVVNVGKYLFIAGNTVTPAYTATDKWGTTANLRKMAVWFRGGAYSRNFTVTVTKTDNTRVTRSYKTKASSYPFPLDTSDILASDPEYQKKVNDRVNDYNGDATKWIGEAAEDITPENIAEQLRILFAAAGITCSRFQGTLCFDDALYKEVTVDDRGDGTLAVAVGSEVANVDQVSGVHYPGKVVKVRPKKNNGTDALYLQAVAKNGTSTDWTEVTWREVAGYEMLPTSVFAIGTVVGGTLYIAGSPADLTALTGQATPVFKANEVGDDLTSPLPFFMTRKITYLGLMQDRLMIGSGAVVFASRPGDYFNWFRQSVLSVADDDPHEMFALGSEDDTIRTSTVYDKNLFLFGDRLQYAINGRVPLKPGPGGTVIQIQSSHEDATDAAPVSSGSYVFYAKSREDVSSIHQVQVGQLEDSPESVDVSEQLDQYIVGQPVEIVAVTDPNTVLVRTDAARNVLYTYTYRDTPAGTERVFDSWSRWTWAQECGHIIGLSRKKSDIIVYMLRYGVDKDGNDKVWKAAERFVLDSKTSTRPHLDSLRRVSDALTPTADSFVNPETELDDVLYIAFGAGGNNAWLGTDMAKLETFLAQYPTAPADAWIGFEAPALVTPTNPYRRDREGRAILTGRLTLGAITVSVADTGGFTVEVDSTNGVQVAADFSGRVLGSGSNLVGRQPLYTGPVKARVGYEVRACKYTIKSKTFLPLTVTGIDWTGQYFNNTRRV